jgi:hypothetical protein
MGVSQGRAPWRSCGLHHLELGHSLRDSPSRKTVRRRAKGHLLTIAPAALALRGRLSRPVPPWVLYAESGVGAFLECPVALL